MAARVWPVWLASLLAVAGCVGDGEKLPLVAPSPFGPPPNVQLTSRVLHAPASQQEAMRVNLVWQKLLLANKETGLRPVFHTVGMPTPEIFHKGTGELYITEGLTKQCTTDAQLAAVLALEMGKMVAEREVLAGPAARRPERLPPQEIRVGADAGGTFGPADGTHLAELLKYEKEGGRPHGPLPPPPDPNVLARAYLVKAGYSEKDLAAAEPILKAARANVTLEKQLRPGPTPVPVAP
jgi:hypothetical protein